MRLVGKRVVLRLARPEDADALAQGFADDPTLGAMLGIEPDHQNAEWLRSTFPEDGQNGEERKDYWFAIAHPESGEPIGEIGLVGISWPNRRAGLSILVLPGSRRVGVGREATLDPKDTYGRVALDRSPLALVNSYFGMFTQLRFFNVWHTFVAKSPAHRSQLWHRDPEDRLILKMFIYLTDVDEGAGPFTYAPGTHPKGDARQQAAAFKEEGHSALRSTDEQVAEIVSPDRWITATGAIGTVILADTRGYHKGGFAREKDRKTG